MIIISTFDLLFAGNRTSTTVHGDHLDFVVDVAWLIIVQTSKSQQSQTGKKCYSLITFFIANYQHGV